MPFWHNCLEPISNINRILPIFELLLLPRVGRRGTVHLAFLFEEIPFLLLPTPCHRLLHLLPIEIIQICRHAVQNESQHNITSLESKYVARVPEVAIVAIFRQTC